MQNGSIHTVRTFLTISIFLSGLSALIYEIAWQRVLARLLGGTLPSVTMTLTIFMAGLALGAAVASRLSGKEKQPLKLFSWLELALGAFGLLFPLLTTQASLSVVLDLVGAFVQLITKLDPIAAYSTTSGALLTNALLAGTTVLLLLAPTTAMGATVPLAARAAELLEQLDDGKKAQSKVRTLGDRVNSLYVFNLTGAVIGSVGAAFALLPWVGLADTIRAAAATNLFTALTLLLTHRYLLLTNDSARSKQPLKEEPPPADTIADRPRNLFARPNLLLVLTGVTAFILLALQVTWVRTFSLLFGSSTYAVAAVIAACLGGLALGGWFSHWLLGRGYCGIRLLTAATFSLAAFLLCAGNFALERLPCCLTSTELLLSKHLSAVVSYMLARCLIIIAFTSPQAAVLGTITPFLLGYMVQERGAKLATGSQAAAATAGKIMCASTLGSIAGAIAAGCLLIPGLIPLSFLPGFSAVSGMQNTYCALGGLELIITITALYSLERDMRQHNAAGQAELPFSEPRRRAALSLVSATCAAALAMDLLHPTWNTSAMSSGASSLPIASLKTLSDAQIDKVLAGRGSRPLFYKEGASSTVSVSQYPENNTVCLKNDGKIEASLPINRNAPAPTSDENTQILLGALPALLCPTGDQTAFLIGYGTGTTAGALLEDSQLKSLTVAELEPAVYQSDRFFQHANHRPLQEAWLKTRRIVPVVADARNLLAISRQQYDMIVSQPAEPWTTGSADLYSLEFWRLARSKLKPHGLFCQWLQLYSVNSNNLAIILRTFTNVFPNTLLFHQGRAGELILIGFEAPDQKLDPALILHRLQLRWKENRAASLARCGIDTSQDLLDLLVGTRESINTFCIAKHSVTRDSRINTDNNLITEYLLPTTIFTAADTIDRNLRALGRVTPREQTQERCSASDTLEQHYAEANQHLKVGELQAAALEAQSAVSENPDCAKCQALLGLIRFEMKSCNAAIIAFKRSLALNPNQFASRMLLGEALLCTKTASNEKEALEQIKAASTVAPERPEPYLAVAAYDTLAGDWSAAALNLDRAAKRKRDTSDEISLRRLIQCSSAHLAPQSQPGQSIEALKKQAQEILRRTAF